jgi:GntR family transcriptional regulator/MocR family aminotransferase
MARAPYVGLALRGTRPGGRLSAQEVVEALTAELRAGRLPAGCRLPPVRVLEEQLGLSRNTVQAAYDELCARGLLVTREREGVFVAAAPAGPPEPPPLPAPPLPVLRPSPPLFQQGPAPGQVALSTVLIDPDLLPRERLADCLRSVLRQPGLQPLYDFQGYGPLREAIAARLRARGMQVQPAEVLITAGSQQALDVVARALEVRRIAVEDPVYPHGRYLFEAQGLGLIGLPLDPFAGIDLSLWERRLAAGQPGLQYAITSFQNPTGYSYTSHELEGVLRLAERHRVPLLEDDWGSDMLSGSEYRPSLRLLGGSNVLYVNSFTKKLLPALRLGFVVAPAALMPALVASKRLSTLGTPPLLEAALAEFLDRGYYDGHLQALQAELDQRYQSCLEALRALMPPSVRWTTPGGGPTLWLELPREVDRLALRAALGARGVFVEDTGPAFLGAPHLHGFRVSYAYLPPETLRGALQIVAEELARAQERPARRRGEGA